MESPHKSSLDVSISANAIENAGLNSRSEADNLMSPVSSGSNCSSFPTGLSSPTETVSSGPSSSSSLPTRAPKRKRTHIGYAEQRLLVSTVSSELIKLDVKKILLDDDITAQVVQTYEENKTLNSASRSKVVLPVAKALLKISINLSLHQILDVALKIVEVFPTESIETYFLAADPPKRRFAQEKLVDKYRNLKSTNNAEIKRSNKRTINLPDAATHDPISAETEKYDAKQVADALAWLQFSREPWPQVLENWEITYEHRKKDIFGRKKQKREQSLLFDYIAKYPVLKCKTGYQLLVADFRCMHENKSSALFAKWNALSLAIKSIAKLEVKDKVGRQFLSYIESVTLTESSETLLLLLLLPYIISVNDKFTLPKETALVDEKGKPKKFWKPSSLESRNSFILLTESPSKLKTDLESRSKFLEQLGLRAQPLVIAVGCKCCKTVPS